MDVQDFCSRNLCYLRRRTDHWDGILGAKNLATIRIEDGINRIACNWTLLGDRIQRIDFDDWYLQRIGYRLGGCDP